MAAEASGRALRTLQLMAGGADGGAETAFVDFCIALKDAGIGVTAATRGNNSERLRRLRAAGIETHVLPFGGLFDIYTPFALRRIIRAARPDIVQTWMARAGRFAPPWRPSSGVPRYAVISRLGNRYKLKNFRHTDYFVAITPDIAAWIAAQGIDPGRVRHINNFAETEDYAPAADRAAEHTPADAKLLVALGRLHHAKAFDVLLQAMTQLPDVHLWIAGEGPERAALEQQIETLDLGARVRLLGWRNDRAALLKAADVCVFPSRYEPFGTVFVQAWASRTPLVASDADGPRQFVRDNKDGLLVPREDASALAAAIRRLLDDPALAKRLVDAGYDRYRQEFSKAEIVDRYKNLYGITNNLSE